VWILCLVDLVLGVLIDDNRVTCPETDLPGPLVEFDGQLGLRLEEKLWLWQVMGGAMKLALLLQFQPSRSAFVTRCANVAGSYAYFLKTHLLVAKLTNPDEEDQLGVQKGELLNFYVTA
jgi:hypothetical protein